MHYKKSDVYERGDVYEMKDGIVKHRKMTDEELKDMLGHIRLNTGFSLPDQLIQDFMNDGSIVPSFKKCVHFNRNDFNSMVQHLKVKKKRLPKKKSKRIKLSLSMSKGLKPRRKKIKRGTKKANEKLATEKKN
jgi:hypothetical protein